MSDLVRAPQNSEEIIQANPELLLKHIRIQLSEKKAQHSGISARLERLQNVEIKQLELQQDVLKEEMTRLQQQIDNLDKAPIDAEFEVTDSAE
jgi:hypothetical protein